MARSDTCRRMASPWARLLLCAMALAALMAACGRPTPAPLPRLVWNGSEITGPQFLLRKLSDVSVYYLAPTMPDQAEKLGQAAANAAEQISRVHRAGGRSLALWVVPPGVPWPEGLAEPPATAPFLAAGPSGILARDVGGTGGPEKASFSGLAEAVAVALTQEKESPVYRAHWLQIGMGAVLVDGWDRFPIRQWERLPPSGDLLKTLADPGAAASYTVYRQAAAALAALVVDRWGSNWPGQYFRQGAELTPPAMARWATGAASDDRAPALWQARMDQVVKGSYNRLGVAGAAEGPFIPTAADVSPVRAEPKLPKLPAGPGANGNYSPHSYQISARYDPDQRRVIGEQQVVWKNGEGIPLDTLWFNLWPNAEQYVRYGGGIRIGLVTVDGKSAPVQPRGLDLAVPLGRQVQPGESVTVNIHFVTTVPHQITMRVFGQTGPERWNLAHWFPILAVLDDRGWNLQPLPTYPGEPYMETADYRVRLDVPRGTVVGATGRPQSRLEQGDRWVYLYDAPQVRDWVATGGTGVRETTLDVEGVTIRAVDEDATWREKAASETARSVKLFNQAFGPYPYRDLVVACCAGLEYPGLFYTPRVDPREAWRITIYHEVAHQWFYAVVGNDQYTEAWLDESFARYGERLGVRAFGPAGALRDLTAGSLPPPLRVTSSSRDYTIHNGPYGTGVYNKGALALEDLETRIGRERFARLMQELVRRYQFKTLTTAEFIQLAEEVAGEELDTFFSEHLIDPRDRVPYTPAYPLGG